MYKIKQEVATKFKNSKGEPFRLTDGQAELFALIFKKKYPRNHIETHTRYGKSDVISMAVLDRVNTYPEKWAIVAGNKEKAGIIMSYAIGHIFDNEFFRQQFIIEKGESEENIRRYRNKSRINFDLGDGRMGEIFITTAEGAMGFGAPNVIEDESALIGAKDHALVMRMLGDQPKNFLVKVGNPWESEHFDKSREDPAYHKLIIDYRQGIREGRLTPAYVDEMRKQPFFDVLYECKRASSTTMDEKAWIPLFTREEIERAMIDHAEGFGINKLGVDVAGGGRAFSTIVQRYSNVAVKRHKSKDPDTMNLAEKVMTMAKDESRDRKYKIRPNDIFVDSVGLGKGVYDILNRNMPGVYGVNGGEKPTTKENESRFVNQRAEFYWALKMWISNGGKLLKDDDWFELLRIKYRTKLEGTRGKMIIISKEEMAREGIDSPDVADALMMTFRTDDIPPMDQFHQEYLTYKEALEEGAVPGWDPMHPFKNF